MRTAVHVPRSHGCCCTPFCSTMDHAKRPDHHQSVSPRYLLEKIAEHTRCDGSNFGWIGAMLAMARSLPGSEFSHDLVMHSTFNDGNCRLVASDDACEVKRMVSAPPVAVYRITDVVEDQPQA